jgi:hypothetical protein
VRHRHPQSIATRGLIAGAPLSACTAGGIQPRNRFKAVRPPEKSGNAGGALDYTYAFEVTVDAANAEIVPGEFVDDLAVLSGTSVS